MCMCIPAKICVSIQVNENLKRNSAMDFLIPMEWNGITRQTDDFKIPLMPYVIIAEISISFCSNAFTNNANDVQLHSTRTTITICINNLILLHWCVLDE